MFKTPNFLKDAQNVYRTKEYIIKQDIAYLYDNDGNARIHSDDTYYLRTHKLDKQFELVFGNRKNLNGKRIHAETYTKKYVL